MKTGTKVRALIMDVDGTLTDGGIYIGNDGETMKKFCAKDGYAIRNMLSERGIIPVIITGRRSQIVENRCRELGIEIVVQGSADKAAAMCDTLDKLGITPKEAAYIGDDLNDYEAMKEAGIKGCPKDAAAEIKNISDFIAEAKGGDGAVREFIEWIGKDE